MNGPNNKHFDEDASIKLRNSSIRNNFRESISRKYDDDVIGPSRLPLCYFPENYPIGSCHTSQKHNKLNENMFLTDKMLEENQGMINAQHEFLKAPNLSQYINECNIRRNSLSNGSSQKISQNNDYIGAPVLRDQENNQRSVYEYYPHLSRTPNHDLFLADNQLRIHSCIQKPELSLNDALRELLMCVLIKKLMDSVEDSQSMFEIDQDGRCDSMNRNKDDGVRIIIRPMQSNGTENKWDWLANGTDCSSSNSGATESFLSAGLTRSELQN